MNTTKEKRNSGVTLVALIITVILLIIISGAAIAVGLSRNGTVEKASNTVENWNQRVNMEEELQNEILGELKNNRNNSNTIKKVQDLNPGELEGQGTQSDPYTINSIEDLVAFAYNVNKGDTTYGLYSGKTVTLGLSLDMQDDKSYANPEEKYVKNNYGYIKNSSGTAIKQLLTDTNGAGFVPIGNNASSGFAGTFDGKKFLIVNLYEKSDNYAGLFGITSNAITISNLGIKECKISGPAPSGGLIGQVSSSATITNCYNTGNVTAGAPTGGILGWASQVTIANCYNTGDINCTGAQAGGIVGGTYGSLSLTDCYNTGNIMAVSPAGGIIGTGYGSTLAIINSNNTGRVSVINSPTGGIIGSSGTTARIENCKNSGEITSDKKYAGGIVGDSYSAPITIISCHNTGDISSGGINGTYGTSGIAGVTTNAKINGCYNTGKILAPNNTGGILGYIKEGSTAIEVSNCYNSGEIVSSNSDSGYGGIIGRSNGSNTNVNNCYNTASLSGSGRTYRWHSRRKL